MKMQKMDVNSRSLSWLLLVIFCWSIFAPTRVYAGGGGPTQPEFNSFTPISVANMVDPFTGDFTYNIPLMEIEGYPINIAYNSGVTMDQEATWVGLGWNLNAGAVTRSLRGLPDDFNGDEIEKTLKIKPTTNISVSLKNDAEIFGFKKKEGGGIQQVIGSQTNNPHSGVNLSFNLSIDYNNYNGIGVGIGVGPSLKIVKNNGNKLTAGFSLSGSSENGASFSPYCGYTSKMSKLTNLDGSKSATIGTPFNSRAGLQEISYDLSLSLSKKSESSKSSKFLSKYTNNNDVANSSGSSFDFGLKQYMPSPLHSTVGASIVGNISTSSSLYGVDGQITYGFTWSRNWIPIENLTQTSKAYGYLFLQEGIKRKESLLDFNRDNDEPFSKYSVYLPSAFLTNDIFSINAQGTGGSFRPIRNDIGYVRDQHTSNVDIGASVGLEFGLGNLTDFGADIKIPFTQSSTGGWDSGNKAKNELNYKSNNVAEIVPAVHFIEANESTVEQDDLVSEQFYSDDNLKFLLKGTAIVPNLKATLVNGAVEKSLDRNTRTKREITNNQFYYLSKAEVEANMGIMPYNQVYFSNAKSHHIGEITQLGVDGRRYVFAYPAYNVEHEEVSFAIGRNSKGENGIEYQNNQSGLVEFNNVNQLNKGASPENDYGLDNYYSSTKTPPYAHSFMLSAVLSDDYIDSDGQHGPSKDDMGGYVKFSYETVSNHQWRTPIQENSAYYNEAMRTDKTDDKASFVHGKKDLHYLHKVETKNYVAIFKTEARKDGRSAKGRQGGIETVDVTSSRLLESITLYAKADFDVNGVNAKPIQQVKFIYDYSLCRAYPANNEAHLTDVLKGGKLTLKEIQFTYQNSKKMKYRSYRFDYSSTNPDYHLKGTDRWGMYKSPPIGSEESASTSINNSEYPYSIQDKSIADVNAGAWSLTKIKTPSGAEINVTYEADDYKYVQNKLAAEMFKIVGVFYADDVANSIQTEANPKFIIASTPAYKNPSLLFNLKNQNDDIKKYGRPGDQLYFRVLSYVKPTNSELQFNANGFKEKSEYVSGYAIIKDIDIYTDPQTNIRYGRLKLEPEKIADANLTKEFSPIVKQALMFGRTQLSKTFYDSPSTQSLNEEGAPLREFLGALINAFNSFGEFAGPNNILYDQGKGLHILSHKSFVRLNCPSPRKIGGGSRVKEIRIKDNWQDMGGAQSAEYGQSFSYVLDDGITSSGVASYEPQLGGDENPWHTALIVNQKKRLALDDKLNIEDPIMESQFPSPSVGYSRVVIEDLKYSNVKRTATGKVVKEFYTAKDFPTIVNATHIDIKTMNSFLPLLPKYHHLVANQGFTIELNDMHGKPKKESIYGEGKNDPLSSVEYWYKTNNGKLDNKVQVINTDGSTSNENIGVRIEQIADFRESKTVTNVPGLQINTNSFIFGVLLPVIPTIYPGYDRTTNRFRSATLNKTVQRFGILEKTVASQDGSIVETRNLAYDAQTGAVLVTQTTTNFNDSVYTLNLPAYWKYDGLGQASKNIMYSYRASSISSNGFVTIPLSKNYFIEGDELIVTIGNTKIKGWVLEKNNSGIKIIDAAGLPITGTDVLLKVIRSGNKNKSSIQMASFVGKENPTNSIKTNQYNHVLTASAVEFGENWKTYCDCFTENNVSTTNPFLLGTKGNWRTLRSYTHLSGRTQTNYNGNTNIRKDGEYTTFTPLYRVQQGKWNLYPENWTFVSEVTEYAPNGVVLETRDALGRNSSTLFGFNNTQTMAVAANAGIRQIAFGSFEDAKVVNCADQGFFSRARIGDGDLELIPSTSISNSHAHTGKTSLKVEENVPVIFENVPSSCEYPNDCDIDIVYVEERILNSFEITGGNLPYDVQFSSTGVDDDAYLTHYNIVNLNVDVSNENHNFILQIRDSKGCVSIFKYVKIGVPYQLIKIN